MATAYREPARPTIRRRPGILVAGLILVIGVIVAAGHQLLASSSTSAPRVDVPPSSGPLPPSPPSSALSPLPSAQPAPPPRGERRGPLGEADGAIPDGTTVFEDGVPGVANLDPALLGSLRQAAADAAGDGVELQVNSGWRSADYQEQLLRDAVSEYGSEAEAARWVSTPETSLHVSGHAVDIGPSDAADWLADHGDDHGLCPIYRNEPWHFELRLDAIDHGCPPMYADPTHDPRMQP